MRYPNLTGLVLLAVALASLAGCGSKVRYPNYYVLSLPPPVTPNAELKPVLTSVEVRRFAAPSFLRAGPIVYRPSAEQVNFYDYHRWATDPRTAVTAAVVESIQARGVFQSVRLSDGRGSPDYLITGMLDRLEEVDQGPDVFVEVHLSAQLMDLRTGDVLWRDTSSESTKLEQRAVPGVVAGMSRAADEAVKQLVASMQNRVVSISASAGRKEAGQP
jgi:cholesterol transport system auxiliary component